jgi:phosphatidylglycerol:prolipoprotein diacylglycerol transferase
VRSPLGAIGWEVIDRFRVGDSFAVSPHGLGIAIGFLAGSYVFLHEAQKRGLTEEQASRFPFWALIGTLVGTRLGYVFTHLDEFRDPLDILRVWQGGISLLGGIFGAILFCLPLVRRYGIRFLTGMDAASIAIPLGIVIGRVGDLIIGDHLGKPTSWALAFVYRGGNLAGYDCSTLEGVCRAFLSKGHVQTIAAEGATLTDASGRILQQGVGVHQTALYDLLLTVVLVTLLVWLNRVPRRTGVLTLTFGVWYGTGRIVTDFLRVENRFFGLTGSQWTSIVVVAVCLATLVRFALRPEARPAMAPAGPEVPAGRRANRVRGGR